MTKKEKELIRFKRRLGTTICLLSIVSLLILGTIVNIIINKNNLDIAFNRQWIMSIVAGGILLCMSIILLLNTIERKAIKAQKKTENESINK